MSTELLYKELSYKIVGLAMEAFNELGSGFLEKVYQNALLLLFEKNGIKVEDKVPINVMFQGKVVGYYETDILVEDKIILELKAVDTISNAHRAQTLNYLKATRKRLAIIFNFGKGESTKLQYERIVL